MIKDKLRMEMREKRRLMTEDEVKEKSLQITEKLFSLDAFINAGNICTFISSFKEPETVPIIEHMWSHGKAVIVPITHTETNTLSLSYIHSMADLERGAFGILEPKIIQPASEDDIGTVLVPGLAFDRSGNRMGFGKGYYDRLLSGSGAAKIGLCYEFQMFDKIPAKPHDVPMDFIITEEKIYVI